MKCRKIYIESPESYILQLRSEVNFCLSGGGLPNMGDDDSSDWED